MPMARLGLGLIYIGYGKSIGQWLGSRAGAMGFYGARSWLVSRALGYGWSKARVMGHMGLRLLGPRGLGGYMVLGLESCGLVI